MEIESKPKKAKTEKKRSIHYVNNKEFSTAVVEYVNNANKAKQGGTDVPTITNYIGECFLKICEGLSHAPNFIRYSYRDEMVMDGVENCVKAIHNFDRSSFEERKVKVTSCFKADMTEAELIDLSENLGEAEKTVKRWYKDWAAGKKDSLPNAFSYFTQIAYYAFLRRIAKEKKQYDIKLKYIESAGIDAFADFGDHGGDSGDTLISKIRHRTNSIRHKDDSFIEDDSHKPFVPPKKKANRGWNKKVKAETTASLEDFEV